VAQYLGNLPTGKKFAFNVAIASSVPLGSGLSSSAALEVATATFLEQILKTSPFVSQGDQIPLPMPEKALRCQKCEHDFCDTPCGIMDQFISAYGEQNSLLLIDCSSNISRLVTMKSKDVAILVTDSTVRHNEI